MMASGIWPVRHVLRRARACLSAYLAASMVSGPDASSILLGMTWTDR